MNMTRATRQIRPARIPNQESSAPIRVPSPLQKTRPPVESFLFSTHIP